MPYILTVDLTAFCQNPQRINTHTILEIRGHPLCLSAELIVSRTVSYHTVSESGAESPMTLYFIDFIFIHVYFIHSIEP